MKHKKLFWIIGCIAAVVFIVILGINLLVEQAADHSFFQQFNKYPLVIAHADSKGYGIAPGDTLLFLEEAAALGVDILEMNVHMTKDGYIVLIHDATVDSTTEAAGRVDEMTLAEIKELEVGVNWTQDDGETFPYRGAGLQIPTMEEVFEALPDYPMNIEIKSESTTSGKRLCEIIKEYDRIHNVLVASSRDGALEAFRKACPEVATSANRSEVTQFVLLNYALVANPSQPDYHVHQVPEKSSGILIMRPGFVNAAQRRNLQVHVWTVDDPDDMQRYIDMGVEGILTNRPLELMDLLGR